MEAVVVIVVVVVVLVVVVVVVVAVVVVVVAVADAGRTPIRRMYWCLAGCRSKRAANRQSKMVESFQESCQSPKQDGIFSRELSTAKQDDGVFPRELSMGSAG